MYGRSTGEQTSLVGTILRRLHAKWWAAFLHHMSIVGSSINYWTIGGWFLLFLFLPGRVNNVVGGFWTSSSHVKVTKYLFSLSLTKGPTLCSISMTGISWSTKPYLWTSILCRHIASTTFCFTAGKWCKPNSYLDNSCCQLESFPVTSPKLHIHREAECTLLMGNELSSRYGHKSRSASTM